MGAMQSMAQQLAELSEEEQAQALAELDDDALDQLLHDWSFWARPEEQLEPEGDHAGWLYLGGRGTGKTRTGSEWCHKRAKAGTLRNGGLVGPTAADVRDIMVEGPSGILATAHPTNPCRYWPSKRKITFHNGAELHCYSADEPDRLRGPNHDTYWFDELAAWRFPEAFEMALLGLRIGDPKWFASTTPKPVQLIRDLLKDPLVAVTRGSTYGNLGNLSPIFLRTVVARYEGTNLGLQELHAAVLDEVPGALWNRLLLQQTRVRRPPALVRVVVACDPNAVASLDGLDSDRSEVGICIAGLGVDGHAYVLADRSLPSCSPGTWGAALVSHYISWDADRIVAETNNGGDMVGYVVHAEAKAREVNVGFKKVTASRGKVIRAEPVAALFERRIAHMVGTWTDLEDQLVQSMAGMEEQKLDRHDAMVWALTELMLGKGTFGTPDAYGRGAEGSEKESHFRGGGA